MNKTDAVTAFRKDKQIRVGKYFDKCFGAMGANKKWISPRPIGIRGDSPKDIVPTLTSKGWPFLRSK